jgi:ABC-type nitrate/sulfonate/bicarbonate transport system ATPase subunit
MSALDSTVRKNIFSQVLLGICEKKTRVLVTHSVDFLHLADRILILN